MKVELEISGGMVKARLVVPRALVLSVALALGAGVTHVVTTWFQFQAVKGKLAACQEQITALQGNPGGR